MGTKKEKKKRKRKKKKGRGRREDPNPVCNHISEQPTEHFAQEIQFYGFVVLELGRWRLRTDKISVGGRMERAHLGLAFQPSFDIITVVPSTSFRQMRNEFTV